MDKIYCAMSGSCRQLRKETRGACETFGESGNEYFVPEVQVHASICPPGRIPYAPVSSFIYNLLKIYIAILSINACAEWTNRL